MSEKHHELRVTPATKGDRAGILRLLARFELPADDVFSAAELVVVRFSGAVVACGGLAIYERFALLRSVAVSELWGGRGLGKRIFTALQGMAIQRGMEAMFLLTTSANARGFFEHAGFEVSTRVSVPEAIKSSAQFSAVCPVTATVMVKRLRGLRDTPEIHPGTQGS